MKIKSPLWNIALRNGLIAGIMAATMLEILFQSGYHPFLFSIVADFRIFLFGIFIFFSVKEYRDRYKQGLLYFWQGMVMSYAFIAVFAVITAMSILLISSVQPEFISDYIRLFIEQATQGKDEMIKQMGAENFERNLEAIRATNAPERALVYVIQSAWIGLFISIIISIILRKLPKN